MRVARWAGFTLTDLQIAALNLFRSWLIEEAIPAGGLGPGEIDLIDRRHIGDSLLFSVGLASGQREVWDFGTGVGLPGIPLAVAHPEVEFKLLDRSESRTTLVRRVVRILRLDNVEVVTGEITAMPRRVNTIVTRATLPPGKARDQLIPRLDQGGRLVIGGSWQGKPDVEGWEVIEVPTTVLDHRVWLLMMRQP